MAAQPAAPTHRAPTGIGLSAASLSLAGHALALLAVASFAGWQPENRSAPVYAVVYAQDPVPPKAAEAEIAPPPPLPAAMPEPVLEPVRVAIRPKPVDSVPKRQKPMQPALPAPTLEPTPAATTNFASANAMAETEAMSFAAAPSLETATRPAAPEPASPEPASSEPARTETVEVARFRVPPAPPPYPRRARDLHWQGFVVLRAFVQPDGNVAEFKVWQSSGIRLLDEAALAAARGWAFEPARHNAVAVAAWVEVPVRFELN